MQAEAAGEKSWGKKGSVAALGAISKLKRKVGAFRSSHETAEERRTESLKFVAKALDPKSSVSMSELLHEVSVVINLKMRMDEVQVNTEYNQTFRHEGRGRSRYENIVLC